MRLWGAQRDTEVQCDSGVHSTTLGYTVQLWGAQRDSRVHSVTLGYTVSLSDAQDAVPSERIGLSSLVSG